MRKNHFILFLVFSLGCFFFHATEAQKKDKKPKGKKKSTRLMDTENIMSMDTTVSFGSSAFYSFPNVGKTPYYYNKKKYELIVSLSKKREWEKLYPLLKEYVSNFGTINFYKDTFWIWRLAKLTESFGQHAEAVLLYKLVLKHHREDIDIRKIELYYDSLSENDRQYYVPLEYYYELVDYRKEVDTLRPPRGVLLNMGQAVNSDHADYGPTLSGDDNVLIFTSKRNSHNRGIDKVKDEDLFLSRKFGDAWDDAEAFKQVNTQYNEGSACISKDGKTLYFARCNAPDGYGDCDLYRAELLADSVSWGNVRNLGTSVNSRAWDSHPSLSHGEDTLYFASDRIAGFGLSDIYYAVKGANEEWSRAINAGPIINTRNNEVSPFFHHVFDVLYFSSNGQSLNFGEFDIYKTYKEGYAWSEPRNIGPLVNGPGSEFYFTIDSQSNDLYYARSTEKSMDNLDLYSFPLPMTAQPGATTKFRGKLTNKDTGEPFKGIVSIIDLDHGIEVAPKFLRPDGSFEFDLINNNNYLLILQGDEFFRIEEVFFLDGDTEFNLEASPISSKLKFESIEFENAASQLTSGMYSDLDKMADFMLDHPDIKLRISGHTDSDGREEFNLKLSQERAESIMEYLVFFGKVPADRITAKGYGSSKPIVEEKSIEDKTLNRRVEFEIYADKENR